MLSRLDHFAQCLDSFKKNPLFAKALKEAVKRIKKAKSTQHQIIIMGVGKSGILAHLFSSLLVSIGVVSRFIHPVEALHGDLGSVNKGDIVVLLSNNGSSPELVSLMPFLRALKVSLIVITTNELSPLLGDEGSLHLPLPKLAESSKIPQVPITSPISTLVACQLIVGALVDGNCIHIDDYARHHPGGMIGKQISLKVKDLMLPLAKIPCVEPQLEFLDLVKDFTKGSLGAVFVMKGQKFLGLISEKDLRVSIEKQKQDVFKTKALDIMNKKPTMVASHILAKDALDLMTSVAKQANFLPVKEGAKVVGLLRLREFISHGLFQDE